MQKPKEVSANFTLLIIFFSLLCYSILKIFKNKNTELHCFNLQISTFRTILTHLKCFKMREMDSSVGSDEGNRMRDSRHKFEACWRSEKLSLKNPSVLYTIVKPTPKNLKCFDFKFLQFRIFFLFLLQQNFLTIYNIQHTIYNYHPLK